MIALLQILLLALYNILPDSPFQSTLDGELYKLDFLPFLNWFVPFDNALRITRVWLTAMAIYYIFPIVRKFINHIFSKFIGD